MKALWLTSGYKLLKQNGRTDTYNGGGWVSSLQRLLEADGNIELGIAYITNNEEKIERFGNTTYYPIKGKKLSRLQKIGKYYGGYKKHEDSDYVMELQVVINNFKPDVIHLFGLENSLATIIGNTSVPLVVHFQGLLGPIDNAFFPQAINKWSFLFPITKREWLARNGYIFAKNSMHERSKREVELFSKLKYCMGRTQWDCQLATLLASTARYYHVDEVLRESFYVHKGEWEYKPSETLVISSTLSDTIYKGLDFILKTASLLKQHTDIKFEWNVVGIGEDAMLVRFFERALHLKSANLNINYLGVLDETALCNVLLNSSVYVHPSYIDNSPNSVCEAQMLGLPLMGTYVGGVPTLIDNGRTGILVPSNAPYELAWHIMQIATEPQPYLRMAKEGCKCAIARHDKKKILQDLRETYQDVAHVGTKLLKENTK
jgi:glycosyltransferase involved in cell wall biosynthesis